MYAGGANVVGRESKLATITHYGEKHLKFYAGDQALSPTYCPALFDEILHFHSHGQPEGHGCEFALDVGTGSGVVAALLAGHFRRVMAIDCDPEPLKRAQPKDNIEYRVARAEALPVPDHSVDLIAVGMALQCARTMILLVADMQAASLFGALFGHVWL
ncbi:S-adenosyl-L-methionine-dependent methyltransferase [Caulochytrium protostelioides]|uniref:S-adenosyl-L-methionine-dependent methyltransferase n=1 Tax=Caulochytrium protostelioides TaxID=1555241 RepID=A0A4P9WRE6_9FUNG|nr:S-adenosyl-L-methionine-dependent methyltransferase [Caulochytrium protostelioides]